MRSSFPSLAKTAEAFGFATLYRFFREQKNAGRQDHTVLPYASAPVILRAVPAHG
jgi:hypothetical protein